MKKKDSCTSSDIQALLLYGSVFLLCLRLFGDYTAVTHAVVRCVYYVLFAGLVTLTGYQVQEDLAGKVPLRHVRLAVCYFGLFLLTGMCRRCLETGNGVVSSLFNLLLLRHIPMYAEIYFSMAALLLSAAVGRPLQRLMHHKAAAAAAGIILLGILWLPSNLFGYSFLGVWLGTNTYSCIPLLAFSLYYFLGYTIAEKQSESKGLPLPLLLAGLLLTAALCLWKFRAFASALTFPTRYWEVLFPFGIVLAFAYIGQKYLLRPLSRARWLTGRAWPRTAVMILALYILKTVGGYSELKMILRPFLFLLVWVVAAVIDLLATQVRKQLTKIWFEKNRIRCWQYILLYTLGFCLLAAAVFLPFLENGISLVWSPDAIAQYYPKAIYFSQYVRDFLQSVLQGSFSLKTYDFTIGMGNRVQFSLYPVYWLYALFSPDNMETGYTALTLVRFWLIGLSASALFIYLKKGVKLTLFCSYIYAFSGYALFSVAHHPQFSAGMIFLPLLVIAVEQILREKKWALGSVLIALSLLSNYYFLYMNTIALIVYFLVRFFCMEKSRRTLATFFSYLGLFAGAYLLGVAMGCMGLVTTFSSYASSGRTAAGVITTDSLMFYRASWPTSVYMFYLTTGDGAGYGLRTGLIPTVYLCQILLFLKKDRRVLKILTVIGVLCLLFPMVGYALGGLSNVNNRWSYILVLLSAVITAEMLPAVRGLTQKDIKVLSLAVLPYILIAVLFIDYSTTYTLKASVLLLTSLLLMIFSADSTDILGRRGMTAAFGLLLAVSLYVSGDVYYGLSEGNAVSEYTEIGTSDEAANGAAIQALTTLEDDSFYRVTESHPSELQLSASMALGLNSISYFNSTINGNIQDFNSLLGNIMTTSVKQISYNNRTSLNALACVKYCSVAEKQTDNWMTPYGYTILQETEYEGENYTIYENQYSLPLGYTYTETISLDSFLEYSPLERQELMMSFAVIDTEETEDQATEIEPVVTSQEIPIDSFKCKNVTWEDGVITAQEGGSITLYFEGLPNSETYLVLDGSCIPLEDDGNPILKIRIKDDCGKYTYLMRSPENTYYLELDEHLINCGYSEKGLSKITLTFRTAGTIYYDELSLYCQPMDDYPSQIAALTEDVLENVEIRDNGLSGTISLTESKLLALSIPSQSGWTAWVDGEETELLTVNIMYMGLELEPGEHSIVLVYEMPGLKIGLAITVLAVVLFVILVLYGRRKRPSRTGIGS
ncbi:MAG: YfhO family protein [Lachnospiraceae bacterium]|nr:YfhO family protein [Lachnospiraceae bacterium]